jgi:hypothetical protein
MKANLFQSGNTDFFFLSEGYGHKVDINGSTVKALIPGQLTSTGNRVIKTLNPLRRGDLVLWAGETWSVIGNVSVNELGVYRANIRLCESKEVATDAEDTNSANT